MNESQIDLMKFYNKPFWHISERSSMPGMIAKSICGDIGRISEVGVTQEVNINNQRICHDCKDIYMAGRSTRLIKKEEMAGIIQNIFPLRGSNE